MGPIPPVSTRSRPWLTPPEGPCPFPTRPRSYPPSSIVSTASSALSIFLLTIPRRAARPILTALSSSRSRPLITRSAIASRTSPARNNSRSKLFAHRGVRNLRVQHFPHLLQESPFRKRFLDQHGSVGQNAAVKDDVIGIPRHV